MLEVCFIGISFSSWMGKCTLWKTVSICSGTTLFVPPCDLLRFYRIKLNLPSEKSRKSRFLRHRCRSRLRLASTRVFVSPALSPPSSAMATIGPLVRPSSPTIRAGLPVKSLPAAAARVPTPPPLPTPPGPKIGRRSRMQTSRPNVQKSLVKHIQRGPSCSLGVFVAGLRTAPDRRESSRGRGSPPRAVAGIRRLLRPTARKWSSTGTKAPGTALVLIARASTTQSAKRSSSWEGQELRRSGTTSVCRAVECQILFSKLKGRGRCST